MTMIAVNTKCSILNQSSQNSSRARTKRDQQKSRSQKKNSKGDPGREDPASFQPPRRPDRAVDPRITLCQYQSWRV